MSQVINSGNKIGKARFLNVAIVQMDANPAPTAERLARAELQVKGAAEAGAQLVVLPEFFNTGYTYSEDNHARVETLDDLTVTWLCNTAVRENIYLAGSLMLLDQGEVYNALLLFAADGRMWRYDKNYPFGWERGSFRGTRLKPRVTVAETELGNIGFLLCWDSAHLNLWESYAGQVDMMVISSCSADIGNGTYSFPNGDQLTFDDLGSRIAAAKNTAGIVFGDMINQQTAWLGVPTVLAAGFGQLHSRIPNGRLFLLGYVFYVPWLLKYLPQADQMHLSFRLVPECKVVNADGEVLTRLLPKDGETFTLAEVPLTEPSPKPQNSQPGSPVLPLAYFSADIYMPMVTKSMYLKGKRKWGSIASSESKSPIR